MNKEQNVKVGLAAVLAVIASAALAYMVTVAWAQPTSPAPTATVTSVTSGAGGIQIVAPNPSRHAIQICVGGAGSTVTVLPATGPTGAALVPVAGTGIQLLVNTCFVPPSVITFSGNSWGGGSAWNAIAAGGTTIVTVLEW